MYLHVSFFFERVGEVAVGYKNVREQNTLMVLRDDE